MVEEGATPCPLCPHFCADLCTEMEGKGAGFCPLVGVRAAHGGKRWGGQPANWHGTSMTRRRERKTVLSVHLFLVLVVDREDKGEVLGPGPHAAEAGVEVEVAGEVEDSQSSSQNDRMRREWRERKQRLRMFQCQLVRRWSWRNL